MKWWEVCDFKKFFAYLANFSGSIYLIGFADTLSSIFSFFLYSSDGYGVLAYSVIVICPLNIYLYSHHRTFPVPAFLKTIRIDEMDEWPLGYALVWSLAWWGPLVVIFCALLGWTIQIQEMAFLLGQGERLKDAVANNEAPVIKLIAIWGLTLYHVWYTISTLRERESELKRVILDLERKLDKQNI